MRGTPYTDKDENLGYHHRLQLSARMPLLLSTSLSPPLPYEEDPVYATLRANDTFHDGILDAESSASRLLVMANMILCQKVHLLG